MAKEKKTTKDKTESAYELDTSFPAVDADDVTTAALEALQTDEQRKVLDIVDALRRQGLSGILELPQIVVCGDQSSGKSSVLEAITEIPFPRNENLCTRFATEVSAVPCQYQPYHTRLPIDQEGIS